MNSIGIISSIVAAFAAVITVVFSYPTWRDSKRNLLRRIGKNERQIKKIDDEIFRQKRSDFWGGYDGSLHEKKCKLQSEVNYLKKLL